MKRPPSRRRLPSALLAAVIVPLSPATQAGDAHHHRDIPCAAQREALFERAGIDAATREALDEARKAHQQAMRELHAAHREQVDEILDEAQREALEQAKRELREEHRAEAREQRLNALFDAWQLSDEKRQALTELRESLYLDMQALRDREFDNREEQEQAWQALREPHHEALTELLDDEQIQALSEAMRDRDDHPDQNPPGHHADC